MDGDERPLLKWAIIYMSQDFQVRRIVIDAVSVIAVGGLLEAWVIDSNQVLVIERVQQDYGQLRPTA